MWWLGNIAALSLNAIPALKSTVEENDVQAQKAAKQWKQAFESGKSQNPPVAISASAAFIYLAWQSNSSIQQVANMKLQLYTAAALLTIGIIPFTLIFMNTTNRKLSIFAQEATRSVPTDKLSSKVKKLLAEWQLLNGIRSMLPLLGGAAACMATLA